MKLFPAIDLFDKKAVRLYKGDYNQMTVYDDNPVRVAQTMEEKGATYLHVVDLEGAKDGTTPNIDVVKNIVKNTSLFVELGGGIRSMETVNAYLDAGISRVILGTAAIKDEAFLQKALEKVPENVAVGADIKDDYIAVQGWLERSAIRVGDFFARMESLGVRNIICTDISKDGAMKGTNLTLYRDLSTKYKIDITASGGVSTLDDILALQKMNLYGAIIGKAYYTGAVDLQQALEAVK